MSKYKYVTEKEFEQVKLLQQAGLTQTQIGKVTGRHPASVKKMFTVQTFEEYQALNRAILARYRPAQQAKSEAPSLGSETEIRLANLSTEVHAIYTLVKDLKTMRQQLDFIAAHMPVEKRSKLSIFER